MCIGAAFSPDVLHLTNDYVLASDIDYMYVMSQDWYAMWNIAARMDIHHTMILYSFTYMQHMYANLMQCHCYSGQHIVNNVMWMELYFVRRSIHS